MSDPGHAPSWAFGSLSAGWAPPAAAAAPAGPKRQRRGPATVLIVLVALGLLTASALVGRPDNGRSASAAMSYLPPSGTRVVLQGSDGTDEVNEYSVQVGITALQSGPAGYGYAVENSIEEFQTTTFVRIATLIADANAVVSDRNYQLFAAGAAGLDLRVAAWADRFLAFRPGLPLLPAGVRDGQSWSATGSTLIGTTTELTGSQPYAADFRATIDANGCAVIDSTLTIGEGSAPSVSASQTTWCPGRGAVAGTADGRTVTAVDRRPNWTANPRLLDDQPPAPSGGSLTRQDLTGLAPMALSPRVPPVLLPGPVAVFANNLGGDLVARGWTDGKTNARWTAHPGGHVTSLLAAGSVVAAATTTRRLVAYGGQGEFLWQADLPDVTVVPLVRVGGQIVVAGLDGSVSAFSAETGAPAWRRRTPNEIRQPLVLHGGGVTVLDQSGNLRTYAADGTELHAVTVDQPESFTVAGGLAVVASRQDGFVRGYRLDDGVRVWRTVVLGARDSMHPVGDTVAIVQNDDITALRAADGAPAWQRGLRPTATTVTGDRLLVSDRTTVYLLDAGGATVSSWPTQEVDLDNGSQTFLRAERGELMLFFGPVGYRWEPR